MWEGEVTWVTCRFFSPRGQPGLEGQGLALQYIAKDQMLTRREQDTDKKKFVGINFILGIKTSHGEKYLKVLGRWLSPSTAYHSSKRISA